MKGIFGMNGMGLTLACRIGSLESAFASLDGAG
jgi:hypothetical protein